MDSQTEEAVRRWKSHRYTATDIPFADAVQSLSTRQPLIEVKRSAARPMDWVFCYPGTATPAVLTYAGVFSEAHPYETGNFVPENENIPEGLDQGQVARFAGFKAGYSYALDTYHDQEIWNLQKRLDEHMSTVAEFNKNGLPRVEWQNGSVINWRFYIKVPMFFPRESRGGRLRAPTGLHPWVTAAHGRSRTYRANPARPQVQAIENGVLRDIQDCTKKELEYGDVVGIIFTLLYSESEARWGPVFMMTDIIRVVEANRRAYPLEVDSVYNNLARRQLSIGDMPEEASQQIGSPSEPTTITSGTAGAGTNRQGEAGGQHSVARTADSNSSAETLEEAHEHDSAAQSGPHGHDRRSPLWDMEVDSEPTHRSAEGGMIELPPPQSPTGRHTSVEPGVGSKKRRRQDDESQIENVNVDMREASDVAANRGKRGTKPGRRSSYV